MQKLFIRQSLVYVILFLFASLFIVQSCKKTSDLYNEAQVLNDAFFKLPKDATPEMFKMIIDLKVEIGTIENLNTFKKYNGVPKWDKSILLKKDIENYCLYIPTQLDNDKANTAFIIANCYNNKWTYEMHWKQSLIDNAEEYSYFNIDDKRKDLMFATFENKLNGSNTYKSLTQQKTKLTHAQNVENTGNGQSFRRYTNITVTNSNSNNVAEVCFDVCYDEEIWWDPDYYTDPCHCSGNEYYMYTTTKCDRTCYAVGGGGNEGGYPTGGGTTGCTGCTGGGSNPAPPPIACHWYVPPTYCEFGINNNAAPCDPFVDSLQRNTEFVNYMQRLIADTTIEKNYESGYVGKLSNNNANNYLFVKGTPTAQIISFRNFTFPTGFGLPDFVSHCHFVSTAIQTNPMFSPDDVFFMAGTFLQNRVRDTNNFFMVLTGKGRDANGNFKRVIYILKVNNAASFRTFAKAISGIGGDDNTKQDRLNKNYSWKFEQTDKVVENERLMLNLIKKEGGGNAITLYRGDTNCNKWTRLGLNGNMIQEKNCY